MKRVIVFDLDGTLAPSKAPISDEMADLLSHLLQHYLVCVISGGGFDRFQTQLLDRFKVESTWYQNIYLMPTNGTSFYRFDHGRWILEYKEEIPEMARERIVTELTHAAKQLGVWEEKTWGNVVEDRGTQITFSGLGQGAPLKEKNKWDPDRAKREKLRSYLLKQLPGFEINLAGESSIDITAQGIDKAYGMKKLQEALGVQLDEILFIGDAVQVGGNDHPVKAMGIETIGVKDDAGTIVEIKKLLPDDKH